MSVMEPESGDPIVTPSIGVNSLPSNWVEFEDMVISIASSIQPDDGH